MIATEVQEDKWQPIPSDLGSAPSPGDTLTKKQLRNWLLVLEAHRLPCRAEGQDNSWRLLVPKDQLEAALRQLRLFEGENRNWPPPRPPARPQADNALAALSVLVLLATFHNLTLLDMNLLGHRPVDWIALGNAHAGKILDGQWWRLATALTLHSGWLHLLSNLAIAAVLVVRLCRDLGSGLAWSLLLASGALGNLINALVQSPDHRAVGASTAVFGAAGLLSAISMVRYRTVLWRRWLLPVAAGAGLLAMLGTAGERTDLGAHLFGFCAGLALGTAVEMVRKQGFGRGPRLNALLALGAGGAMLACWWAALTLGA